MFDDPRFREPGWVLLPLRAFLGVTFVYAGIYKLADPHYLDAASRLSVHAQMAAAAKVSPIGGLVSFTAGHATFFGLLIAFGELAAGLGALLGLWTRLAAAGGMALSLSFFLTASWGTTPYFLGPDIGVFFAWSAVLLAGDGGVFSLQSALQRAVRREMRLPAVPTKRESPETAAEVDRRTLIRSGAVAGVVGGVTVLVGGATAWVRQGSADDTASSLATTPVAATPSTAPSSSPSAAATASGPPSTAAPSAAPGVAIMPASAVPVGSAQPFTDPQTGNPAYLLQPKAGVFRAYSAICTHQGCTVSADSSGFTCPCHGAVYDASGNVVSGPAPAPLQPINVVVVAGQVRRV